MGQAVVTTAQLQCSFGLAPSVLNTITMVPTVMIESMPAGNIMCNTPLVGIPPFGMCNCPANPTVAAATVAAMGVLTPMPCIPQLPAPWLPQAPTVMIAGKPALVSGSTLMCAYGGEIQILMAGSTKTMIG